MKKLIIISALCLTIISCTIAYNTPRTKGSGNVTKQERITNHFNKLEIDLLFNTTIVMGNKEGITIESDDNIQDFILNETNNETLVLKMKNSLNLDSHTNVNITVYAKELTSLKVSGMGSVTCNDTIYNKEFTLEKEGMGNTSLILNTNNTTINKSGMGNMSLKLKSVNIKVYKEGMGNIDLHGTCTSLGIKHEGMGEVKAKDLISDILYVDVDGMGNTEAYANKQMDINKSGMGRLDVYGDGVIRKIKIEGMGEFKKH